MENIQKNEKISKERYLNNNKGHKKYEKFKNKNFPFNFRFFVPEINIDNFENNSDYFRVITYNILADSLLPVSTQMDESELKKYSYMHWTNRKQNILAELKELRGDLICIQEFERDEEFISTLGNIGYDVNIYLIN